MGELRALRLAGRARRIEDDRRVLGVGLVGLVARLGLSERADRLRIVPRHRENHLGAERLGALAPRLFEERMDDEHARAGILEEIRDFGRGSEHVDGNDRRAGVEDAEVGDRELGHVRHEERDLVAGLDAPLAKARRDTAGRAIELAVGHRALTGADHDRFGLLGSVREEDGSQIQIHGMGSGRARGSAVGWREGGNLVVACGRRERQR